MSTREPREETGAAFFDPNVDHVAIQEDLIDEGDELTNMADLLNARSKDGSDTSESGDDVAFHNLHVLSTQVVAANTLKAYQSTLNKAIRHFREKHWIAADSTLSEDQVPVDMPKYICLYIAHECDEIDINTKEQRPANEFRNGYGHATKIRAAFSHHYGRVKDRGRDMWQEYTDGTTSGNPSISNLVGNYMMGLRRRKRISGDVSVSARALNAQTLRKLYDVNQAYIRVHRVTEVPALGDPMAWANANTRIMLTFLYSLSFWCLLRSDEALQIKWHQIEHGVTADGTGEYLKVSLPFRKTHQFGGVAPFYIHRDKRNDHLCPVRAYAAWMKVLDGLGLEPTGFVFRNPIAGGRFTEDALKSGRFLDFFRHNLLDARIDPHLYGTHSFRRGGAQHLYDVRRMSIKDITSYGGWSPTESEATLFKYLYSWVDSPVVAREHLLDPNPPIVDICPLCGRSCHCRGAN